MPAPADEARSNGDADNLDPQAQVSRACLIIDHRFSDLGLLRRALTHASAKSPDEPSYERFEFLGDAILEFVISEAIFKAFPDAPEGDLTRMRAALVSAPTLARLSNELGLEACLIASRGLLKSSPSQALCADLFESVAAAIFLDAGLPAARDWILQQLGDELQALNPSEARRNYKSLLQQATQQQGGALPSYSLTEASGPDHQPRFVVHVSLAGQVLGQGEGSTKKAAQQAAARQACERHFPEIFESP